MITGKDESVTRSYCSHTLRLSVPSRDSKLNQNCSSLVPLGVMCEDSLDSYC